MTWFVRYGSFSGLYQTPCHGWASKRVIFGTDVSDLLDSQRGTDDTGFHDTSRSPSGPQVVYPAPGTNRQDYPPIFLGQKAAGLIKNSSFEYRLNTPHNDTQLSTVH
ncbi:uncharacterized protein RAG0_06707 [Rhynchosporium agropyri]|uniref:Uncharacterized protein n=2 Tax=Rhynchosporium TaxID=38037 RepID=A0A1E1M6E5_RHYSE|nr:uncharacterized protein RAG0_06707 [Rhynchosporium agropyri]CZT44666.1 uncharacterized protein RSE6_04865 [Rhynchosporium secalis]